MGELAVIVVIAVLAFFAIIFGGKRSKGGAGVYLKRPPKQPKPPGPVPPQSERTCDAAD